ncbi:MAG: (Fe-S)-binding protein [Ardenticatenaceae bacterium]|nr:(Fe-S)-binding protein [Anaerolineales bacterium]MCB8922567.1 (Fe-S)-binding protein [Ardenticatenaceae bacterium]MCB8991235.1 (Fe-S)-binding protein [Ardenticatenaceae bacterium]MCB9003724.1 (Fe-S)-binding protein [Ardenticatenaceae bacterium]
MLTNTEKLLFILLVAISLMATYNTFGQMFRIVQRGQGKLNFDNLGQRIWNGFIALMGQGRLIRRRKLSSVFHYGVAWGFIFYFLVNAIDVMEGMITGFHFLEGNFLGDAFRFLADIFSVVVLVGVLYFLIRRFAAKDPVLSIRENVKLMPKARAGGVWQDSLVVGVFILLHVGFRLFGASALVAQHGNDAAQPFATLIANTLFANTGDFGLTVAWRVGWWVALGLILFFLPYFPYTKHAHLFVGPFNFMTAPERTYLGQVKTLDFENESIEQFGAASLFDLEQTRLVDAFACIMCNRCQEACPAYNTGKELSPAALEVNKRYHIKENMTALAAGTEDTLPLMDFAISESAVWACTTCGACIDACPVGNTPMLDILDIRRDQVLMASEFPSELQVAFRGMERNGNPWQSTESRMEWAKPLDFDVPTVDENPDYEYLLWVGCAGAFNPEAQQTVRAVATIMHEAGVSFAVLGDAESCTGDSARRAGNEYLYYEMAMGNIDTLNSAKANERKIVTSCPHCFTTIGKEYGELGGHYQTYHHTQLIADLVGKSKLRLNGSKLEKVTFHDPCYLGRHNGVVDAPRDALAQAGFQLLEMERSGSNSFCCGAGGAQMWKEEEHGTQAMSMNRFQEAHGTGATTLAVGCPFCGTMMHDANREEGSPMQVKDVAELVLEAMK